MNRTYNLDVEYAAQAIEFSNQIPYGYIDKTVCGCGLTTLAIENDRPTIIAVPNQELTANKAAQYPNERFSGKILAVKAGVLKRDIERYVEATLVPKIMVTYDSLWKCEELLNSRRFDLVIDESEQLLKFQRLKLDDKKSIKDEDVLTTLFRIAFYIRDRVSFISATPVPTKYMPNWIKDLPQIKMNWSNVSKAKPYLIERTYPFKALREEIIKPLNNNGVLQLSDATIKKVIIFMNSVSNIMKTIKDCNLKSEDVALVLGDNLNNDVKIRGYKRLTNPAALPKFTFITSVGFQGIDLYDKEAFSIVVSNTSQGFTMIDMLTDMKQAISRQRCKDNVNYGKYGFIYNQNVFSKTENEIISEIDKIESSIKQAIVLHEMAKNSGNIEGFELLAKDSRDFKIYTVYDSEKDVYEINDMAFNADRYMILELRQQFTKGYDVRGNFDDSEVVNCTVEMSKDVTYVDLVKYFKDFKENNPEKVIFWGEYSTKIDWIGIIEKCWSLYTKTWINITTAKIMLENYNNDFYRIGAEIKEMFLVGRRYSRLDIKSKLNGLYEEYDVVRKAKHTDLQEYFVVKECKIDGNRGLEIVGVL